MRALKRNLLDYAAYLALRLVEMVLRMFDVRSVYRAAGRAADLYCRLSDRRRERALEHLRRSFPEMSPQQREAAARESMRSMLFLGLEVMYTTRRITPANWRKHIELHNVGPMMRVLLEQKTGAILVSGHFGNWEVLGFTMAVLGFPSAAVARPLDNRYLSDYLMDIRERAGQSILYKAGATQTMHDVLDARGVLAFIADQDAGPKGVFVDFLHRPASTYKSVALMAMRHDVPLAVGYGRRLGEDYRFEIGIERIIHPREWSGRDDPLRWITQAHVAALAAAVRRHPGQYVWTHRRWRTRPPGEDPVEDGIA